MAKFLIIFFTSISISFCLIAAMDESLSSSSPSSNYPPPFPFSALENVFSPHFTTPLSSISQILTELGFRIIKRVNVPVNFQYEAITVKAIKENVVNTSWKVIIKGECDGTLITQVMTSSMMFSKKHPAVIVLLCKSDKVDDSFILWPIFVNQLISKNGSRVILSHLEAPKGNTTKLQILNSGQLYQEIHTCDVGPEADFYTGLDTSINFILGDINSHMAMKYSVGHALMEILPSSLTINTTMPPNQVVPPSLYLDADHYPP